MKKTITVSIFIYLIFALISLSAINENANAQDVPPADDSVTTSKVPGIDSIYTPGN